MSLIMPNGKHAGMRIEHVPVDYLRWMVSAAHSLADQARAELERRGTSIPPVDISMHAIDRASLHAIRSWENTRHQNEGIATWLGRRAKKALDDGTVTKSEGTSVRVAFDGLRWAFDMRSSVPLLKTLMPGSKREAREAREARQEVER